MHSGVFYSCRLIALAVVLSLCAAPFAGATPSMPDVRFYGWGTTIDEDYEEQGNTDAGQPNMGLPWNTGGLWDVDTSSFDTLHSAKDPGWLTEPGAVTVNFTGTETRPERMAVMRINVDVQDVDLVMNGYDVGSVYGARPAGVSWEIGFGDNLGPGADTLYERVITSDPPFEGGTGSELDNATTFSFAHSMALGYDFALLPGETASVVFNIGFEQPDADFYLQQTDPETQQSLYFWGSFTQTSTPVPDGGMTALLLAVALPGLQVLRQRRRLR